MAARYGRDETRATWGGGGVDSPNGTFCCGTVSRFEMLVGLVVPGWEKKHSIRGSRNYSLRHLSALFNADDFPALLAVHECDVAFRGPERVLRLANPDDNSRVHCPEYPHLSTEVRLHSGDEFVS